VASILQTLHTITVRRAIQGLYSIHNPGHDIARPLTKYWKGLEELLVAARVKYEPVPTGMLAAVLPSSSAQLYQEAFFGEQRVGSEYLVAASSSGQVRSTELNKFNGDTFVISVPPVDLRSLLYVSTRSFWLYVG
jgi:hypothetical protein